VTLALALHELYPAWEVDHVERMLQWAPALEAIKAQRGVDEVLATWAPQLASFVERRSRFLLYP
jgi:hypothetical protein